MPVDGPSPNPVPVHHHVNRHDGALPGQQHGAAILPALGWQPPHTKERRHVVVLAVWVKGGLGVVVLVRRRVGAGIGEIRAHVVIVDATDALDSSVGVRCRAARCEFGDSFELEDELTRRRIATAPKVNGRGGSFQLPIT